MVNAAVTDLLRQLELRFGQPLRPLTQGSEARTFGTDGLVCKIYGPKPAWPHQPAGAYAAHLEAANMSKAGLGAWVVEAFELDGHGILVTRRFPGHNFEPQNFTPEALKGLREFFCRLHQIPEMGVVSRQRLWARLEQFGGTLHDLSEAQALVKRLQGHLEEVAGTPQAFCHRDPHAGNVLLRDPGAPPDVPAAFLVDWVRACPDDPARDLAILTTGTLDLLGEEQALSALRFIVRGYPDALTLWPRLRFWLPLTYLHDMHWFRVNEPSGFEAAVAEKMPKALRFYWEFPEL
jgi:hypothetical protein